MFLNTIRLKNTLSPLLQQCSSLKDLKTLLSTILTNNFQQDPFITNQFLSACSRLRQIDYAFLAFSSMAEPNIFVCNAMIGCLASSSAPIDALHLFVEMSKSEQLPTCHTFSHLIKACAQIPALGFGKSVHGLAMKSGFSYHLVLQTGLIHFYSSAHQIFDSRKVFDEATFKDAFSWNTMIFAYTLSGNIGEAKMLFDEMPGRNIVSWNVMIAGYARFGDVESANSLFKQVPNKNLISWTSMIACYAQNKLFKEALEIFDEMNEIGLSPDKVTMATVISACAHLGALSLGRRMHRLAVLNGFDIDVYIGSALIDMYAKCGSIEKSLAIFFKLKEKNLFCWNSVIDGLAQHGQPEQAFYMLSKMAESRFKPNGITFISVLGACNHAGLVEEGRRMFLRMVEEYSIVPEIEHYSCMVDLLSRAGLLQEALCLIQKIEVVPNTALWGALLSGCRTHGNMEIGMIAMERLAALDPSKSSSHMLMVNIYAKEKRWEEVAAVRRTMKDLGVQKEVPACSWIEVDGKVHEFAASDTSHPSFVKMFSLFSELYAHMELASFRFHMMDS